MAHVYILKDVTDCLLPLVSHLDDGQGAATANGMPTVAMAALSCGMIYVSSCDETMASTLLQRVMESSDAELTHTSSRFLVLALGLLFFGQQEKSEAILEALKTVVHPTGTTAAIVLETCAYAGTGNVLMIQKMLHLCAEHLDDVKDNDEAETEVEGTAMESTSPATAATPTNVGDVEEVDAVAVSTTTTQHQAVAVLGIGLITMGESIGTAMAVRAFDHLIQYGELPVRRAVPLGLAIGHISNPDFSIVDTLSRLTHDTDAQVSGCAILALGLVSAGTNNSRVAGLLRQLSEFYTRDAANLFLVRIAQGLLHLAKGLMTLSPFHSDRLLLSGVAMSGILTVLTAALDVEHTLLDTSHHLLYHLVTAMQPRMLITLDEDMNPLPVTVRVGQAVEVVGQAGRPKTITGFQTHTTPVLLNVSERAQLASEEYLALSNVLEGIVILRKNPDYAPAE